MKTLYLDCGMGAAGDMLAGALYDLLSEEQRAEFRNIAAPSRPSGLNCSLRCRPKNAAFAEFILPLNT